MTGTHQNISILNSFKNSMQSFSNANFTDTVAATAMIGKRLNTIHDRDEKTTGVDDDQESVQEIKIKIVEEIPTIVRNFMRNTYSVSKILKSCQEVINI